MSMVCCLLSTVYCPWSNVYCLWPTSTRFIVFCLLPTDIVYQVRSMVCWVYGLLLIIVSQLIITALHTVVYIIHTRYAVWKKVSHITYYRSFCSSTDPTHQTNALFNVIDRADYIRLMACTYRSFIPWVYRNRLSVFIQYIGIDYLSKSWGVEMSIYYVVHILLSQVGQLLIKR